MGKSKRRHLPTIGWREWVLLPDLGTAIKVKVDTGALSSAIHAYDIEEYEDHGRSMVGFTIHPRQRRQHPSIRVTAEVVDRRDVRNSGGRQERRIVVLMDLALGDQTWTTEVTLTRRDQMGFRMLLGRRAVRNRFQVDPGASFLIGRRPARKRPTSP